jgi:hypothetical protein
MTRSSASQEPIISISYRGADESDGDAELRARQAILALARLIARQIARRQHAARLQREAKEQ